MTALALMLVSSPVISFAAVSLQQANDQGKNLGLQDKNEVGTSRINEETASQVPFFKPSPVQKDGFQGGFGDMLNIGVDRITQSKSYSAGSCDREGFDPALEAQKSAGATKWAAMTAAQQQQTIQSQRDYFDQECEGINFLAGEYQMRQKIEIPPNDDLAKWTPPTGIPDENGNCSIQEITTPPEFVSEVCYDSRTIENRFCQEDLRVQCEPPLPGNCASEGIIRGSVSVSTGNYSYSFNGSQLVLHNTITQPWSQTYANFNFNIEGVDRIEEFRAVQVQSDNWVGIAVNGVYLGTHSRFFGGWYSTSYTVRIGNVQYCAQYEQQCTQWGGGDSGGCMQYEQVCTGGYYNMSQVFYSPTGYRGAETGDSFASGVNVNLIPYLKEGNNTITMYVIDGGPPGNGTIWINAYQKCPPRCSYDWSDNCAPFENVLVGG